MRWVNVQEIYADGKHNAWPDICRWRNRYYVTFNSGGVGHSNGHSICLLSSTDGERWEKIIECPSIEWTISTDATRGALCPKLLPTNDRLIVMFYYYAPGETNVSDEQKQHIKGRWLELNGSEQSFERWIGHHEVSFRTGTHTYGRRSYLLTAATVVRPKLACLATAHLRRTPLCYRFPMPRSILANQPRTGTHDSGCGFN